MPKSHYAYLPQVCCVGDLLSAADKVLSGLPSGPELDALDKALKEFEDTTTLTCMNVEDVAGQEDGLDGEGVALSLEERRVALCWLSKWWEGDEGDWIRVNAAIDKVVRERRESA